MTQKTTTTKITLQGGTVGGTLQVLIYGDIFEDAFFDGAVSARSIVEILNENPNVATIEVRINSGGGSAFDGIAIHNVLRQHAATVNVFVDGIAASSASIVAMAGDVINMAESSQMMIHNSRTSAFGDKDDHRAKAEVLAGLDEQMAAVYMAQSGKSKDATLAQMNAETWFSAKDAVKEGLADNVVENLEVAASLDLSGYGYRNTPAAFMAHTPDPAPATPPKITAPTKAHGDTTMKIFAQAAGLRDDAPDVEIVAKINKLLTAGKDVDDIRAQLTAAQGELSALTAAIGENGDAALGTLTAWKASHEKVEAITAELDEIKAGAEKAKHVALVEQGKADGKITADLETLVADWTCAQLEAFLKAAPKVVPIRQNAKPPTEPTASKDDAEPVVYKGKPMSALSGNEMVAFKTEDPDAFATAHEDYMEARA